MGADRPPAERGVVLVGPRGAGKTTVGRELATLLGMAFVDSDHEVERATRRTIAGLLAGGLLRDAEATVLSRVLSGAPCVLATGGGAVLWSGLAAAASDWCVVWLDAEPEELARRLRADPRPRPSLTGRAAADEISEVRRSREAAYRAVAGHRIDTTAHSQREVSRIVARVLSERCDTESGSAD